MRPFFMFDFMDVRGICWLPFFISASRF